jgi:D-alanine-D-alanine ligase
LKKSLILHQKLPANAQPDELDVMDQATAVKKSLKELDYNSKLIPVTLNFESLKNILQKENPDLVVNLVETLDGQGRLIYLVAALLEFLDIPFTGNGQMAINVTTGKVLAKKKMQEFGLPTPEFYLSAEMNKMNPKKQYILKPVWEDASVGIRDDKLVTRKTALAAFEKALQTGIGEWFFEEYIEGREFNVTLLETKEGWKVLNPAEILFVGYPKGKPKILGYESKWSGLSFEYKNTPRTFDFNEKDKKLIRKIKEISRSCIKPFELGGYARIDFRVDENNDPTILEINANPCLSPDAGFFAACQNEGISYTEMIGHIIDAAIHERTHIK